MSEQRACMSDDDTPDDEPEQPIEWLSVREAARRAGVPSRTVYHWIEAGTWPVRVVKWSETRRPGVSTMRVRADELEAWLAERQ